MARQTPLSSVPALRSGTGGPKDLASLADSLEGIWREIGDRLFGIVGQQGVAGLYQRSLHVAAREHAWLADCFQGAQAPMDLNLLRTALMAQPFESASAGATALLDIFYQILVGLVGVSMSERLLRSIWHTPSSGSSPQDNS